MAINLLSVLEGRADDVAAWLRDRFRERDVWVASELDQAARAAGIDPEVWSTAPSVLGLAIKVETVKVPWLAKPLVVARLPDPNEEQQDDGEVLGGGEVGPVSDAVYLQA